MRFPQSHVNVYFRDSTLPLGPLGLEKGRQSVRLPKQPWSAERALEWVFSGRALLTVTTID